MKSKKILAIILAVAMACAFLASCGGGSQPSPSPAEQTPSPAEQTPATTPSQSPPPANNDDDGDTIIVVVMEDDDDDDDYYDDDDDYYDDDDDEYDDDVDDEYGQEQGDVGIVAAFAGQLEDGTEIFIGFGEGHETALVITIGEDVEIHEGQAEWVEENTVILHAEVGSITMMFDEDEEGNKYVTLPDVGVVELMIFEYGTADLLAIYMNYAG